MLCRRHKKRPLSNSTWGHANGESNKRIGSLKLAPLKRRTSGRERYPFLVFTVSLVTALSFCCQSRPAFSEGLDSLGAHLGFLSEKPKSLPLPLPVLPASRADETTSYTVSATYSATGVTLVLYYQNRSKVKVKRSKTSDGKKLEHNAWSGRRRSKRYTILSFDGLGPGENAIQFEVEQGRRKEKTKVNYDVSVVRATTPGSDAGLTALALSKSSLAPAFAPETKTYQAAVPYGMTDVEVTVGRKEAATNVRLQGTAADGSPLKVDNLMASGLTVGRNTLELTATAEDGKATVGYTITVSRIAPSRDTKLTGMALAEGKAGFLGVTAEKSILSPAFDRDTDSYEATVAATATTVTITISNPSSMTHKQSGTAADGSPLLVGNTGMSLTMDGTTRRSVAFDGLQAGKNNLEIRVTAEDGVTSGTYQVTVIREGGP